MRRTQLDELSACPPPPKTPPPSLTESPGSHVPASIKSKFDPEKNKTGLLRILSIFGGKNGHRGVKDDEVHPRPHSPATP
jgi:hypothetical protein